jgi:hypothetical protein
MGAPRRLAAALLRFMLRLAPQHSREWALAMLGELDSVPGEWTAFLWALGGAAAILRHAGCGWRNWITQIKSHREERMNSTGKKAIGLASGAVSALLLVLCAFGLLRLVDLLFPSLGIANTEWTHVVGIIVIPEAILIAAVVMLWRKRAPIAVGILLTAVTIGLHAVIHVASH